MRRARWLLALACVACTRTRPSVTPEDTSTAASSSAEASPPASAATAGLPPWMRALFEPGPRRTYAWTYEVPTHDVDGSVASASGTLRCRTDGPTRHVVDDDRSALVSCHACDFEPGSGEPETFEPDFDDCYLATADGLWLIDAPPEGEDQVQEIVDSPPYLPAHPEPRQESEALEDDGHPYEQWLSVTEAPIDVLGHSTTAWCRREGHSLFYGEQITRCFAPGFGLVTLQWEGRDGPSWEHYPLVAIDPPPVE